MGELLLDRSFFILDLDLDLDLERDLDLDFVLDLVLDLDFDLDPDLDLDLSRLPEWDLLRVRLRDRDLDLERDLDLVRDLLVLGALFFSATIVILRPFSSVSSSFSMAVCMSSYEANSTVP